MKAESALFQRVSYQNQEQFDADLSFIADHIWDLCTEASPMYKTLGDRQSLDSYLVSCAHGREETVIITWHDVDNHEMIGVSLFTGGQPWWNRNIYLVREDLTLAFKKGYGLTRCVAKFMENLAKSDQSIKLLVGGCSIEKNMGAVANSYKKCGYSETKEFHKIVNQCQESDTLFLTHSRK